MGEGELIRKVIGRPREKTEAEHIAWYKDALLALGIEVPPGWDAKKSYCFDPENPRDFQKWREIGSGL